MAVRTPTNPLGLSDDTDVTRVIKVVEQNLSHIETDGIFGTPASSVIEEAFRIIGVDENNEPLGMGSDKTTRYGFVFDDEVFEITVRVTKVE